MYSSSREQLLRLRLIFKRRAGVRAEKVDSYFLASNLVRGHCLRGIICSNAPIDYIVRLTKVFKATASLLPQLTALSSRLNHAEKDHLFDYKNDLQEWSDLAHLIRLLWPRGWSGFFLSLKKCLIKTVFSRTAAERCSLRANKKRGYKAEDAAGRRRTSGHCMLKVEKMKPHKESETSVLNTQYNSLLGRMHIVCIFSIFRKKNGIFWIYMYAHISWYSFFETSASTKA